jgi:hypothetical protein
MAATCHHFPYSYLKSKIIISNWTSLVTLTKSHHWYHSTILPYSILLRTFTPQNNVMILLLVTPMCCEHVMESFHMFIFYFPVLNLNIILLKTVTLSSALNFSSQSIAWLMVGMLFSLFTLWLTEERKWEKF